MRSLFFATLLLSMLVSCKPDEVTNQYNQPKEVVSETSVVATPKKEVKSIGEFSFDEEISLPAYSNKLVFTQDMMTCEVSYEHSNFDRKLETSTKFNVESGFFYVHSKEQEELSYAVYFSKSDSKVEKVDCRIKNAFSAFLNKDMLEALQVVIKESSIFSVEDPEVKY